MHQALKYFVGVISRKYKIWVIFGILMTITLGVNMITGQMTPFFHLLFELYFIGIFHFCVSKTWKFSSLGSTLCTVFWSIKYTNAKDDFFKPTKIDILFLQNFANYVTRFIHNLISMRPQSHRLVGKKLKLSFKNSKFNFKLGLKTQIIWICRNCLQQTVSSNLNSCFSMVSCHNNINIFWGVLYPNV